MMRRCTVRSLLIVSGMMLAALPALADEANVDVGGEHLITIHAATGGKTAQQRADAVTDRLPNISAGRPSSRSTSISSPRQAASSKSW